MANSIQPVAEHHRSVEPLNELIESNDARRGLPRYPGAKKPRLNATCPATIYPLMNTTTSTHTHEKVSQRAQLIWQNYGRPVGRDIEIWHEAERQIGGSAPAPKTDGASPEISLPMPKAQGSFASVEQMTSDMAAESVVEFHLSPALPDREAIQAALQKNEARAPKVPHKTAPKRAPTESGKPLWNKPHSS